MDRKRRKTASIYATALIVLVVLLAIYLFRMGAEPRHGGLGLDDWIQQYCHAVMKDPRQARSSTFITRVNGRKMTNTVVYIPSDFEARAEAAIVLKQMGKKAIPAIEHRLRSRENMITRKYRLCSILLPWNIRKHLPGLQDRDNIRADAAEAVQALGSSARDLAPALLNMLSDEDPNTRAFSTAIKTLNKIAVSDESFDPLLEHWRRERRIAQIACFFEVTTLSTTNAALALCALLESNDPSHQLLAYTTLRRMGKNAGPATPVLLQKLDDADVERRYQTVRTLESIGTNAGAALPKLTALLDDTNRMVRTASLRCIKTITGAP